MAVEVVHVEDNIFNMATIEMLNTSKIIIYALNRTPIFDTSPVLSNHFAGVVV